MSTSFEHCADGSTKAGVEPKVIVECIRRLGEAVGAVAEDEAAARLEPALRLPGRVLLRDARGVQVLHHGCGCRSADSQ